MAQYRSLVCLLLVTTVSQALGWSMFCNQDKQVYPPQTNVTACYQSSYHQLVTFGDSWTENGNGPLDKASYASSNFLGRMTNGPTWAEYLAKFLGSDLYNQAYSGATANNSVVFRKVKDVSRQIDDFRKLSVNLDPHSTLYTIWIGVNDIHDIFVKQTDPNQQTADVSRVLYSIRNELDQLYTLNARRFMLMGLASIDRLPLCSNFTEGQKSDLRNLITSYNRGLQDVLAEFKKSHSSANASIPLEAIYFDSLALFEKVAQAPLNYGLSDIKNPCKAKRVCDRNMWFDQWHPTTLMDNIVAKAVYSQIA